ncbi:MULTISPECIES: helix-turn-helix transcriptional regulator [unclassified Mycolicibacterium]|nr:MULTISPECIES: helix-turn-helix transcriptional regulator [unclassified Mycolicibacterium]
MPTLDVIIGEFTQFYANLPEEAKRSPVDIAIANAHRVRIPTWADGDTPTQATLDTEIRRTVQLLKDTRTTRGMTIADVAGYMGVDKSVVTKFENNTSDPRMSTILRYAHAVRAAIVVYPAPTVATPIVDGIEFYGSSSAT